MRIFVAKKTPLWEEVSKPLVDDGHEGVVYPNHKQIERKEIEIEIEKGYDGLRTLLTEKVDEEWLVHDKKGQLKVIANYAVGFDNIDLEACKKRSIAVTNTPCNEVNESVAGAAWALVRALSRRLPGARGVLKN